MQMLGDAADNPDQRIAEDIRQFIELGLFVGVGLLGSIVSLASFVVILWGLSAAAPLTLYGVSWNIPGYLVWAALAYAAVGTLLTHFVGRPLIALNFNQQRYEADFRFNLVRVRENSEQIALLRGETAERGRLMERFVRGRGQLASHHDAAEAAHLLDRRLQPGLRDLSVRRREPGLFRRPYPAWRAHADGGRVQQRAERALVLRRYLCAHRRMARRDRAPVGLPNLDRERACAYLARAEHRAHHRAGQGRAARRHRGDAAVGPAAGRRRRHRDRAARPGAGQRPVGLGQVDAVPRDRRASGRSARAPSRCRRARRQ